MTAVKMVFVRFLGRPKTNFGAAAPPAPLATSLLQCLVSAAVQGAEGFLSWKSLKTVDETVVQ